MNRLDIKRWFKEWANQLRSAARHPRVLTFSRKYPRLYRFMLLRFDPHHFRGLPFTLLVLGVLLNTLVLSQLAEEIREISRLRKADLFLADFFYLHRSKGLGTFLYRFSKIGSSPIVLSLLGIFTMVAVWKKRFHAWIAISTALFCSTVTAYFGKVYYQMPRPGNLAWYDEFSYSFPSGHATVSVAYYGILFYILLHAVQRPVLRISVRLGAVLFILLIGFSRIYLCVHYLSDVMAGYAIGLLWFLFSAALLSWLDFRKEMRS
ncbi:MAG: phosphatase PAP2 family protein [Bacteroidia bacterium]